MEDEGKRINRLKICVIVPTYNNAKTLQRVIDSILVYSSNIIIINDGSTDDTFKILQTIPSLTHIHLRKNSGKGNALRAGFKKALDMDYDYAITIDSDGQHFASDIPRLIDVLELEERALIIGSRNMAQEGVPKKSSFGNQFSNFWFWFETGNRLQDTQSGYRLYPLKHIPKKYFTSKFEFEIEVIVRSAWKRIPIKNVPIAILYDSNERVSHFRPFKDFTRISILNTVLVIIAVFYIKPRDFFRHIKEKGLRKFFFENILESNDSNTKKAGAIALGIFMGIAPFWGFQTILVLFFAVLFKTNKAIAFAFSNISFPPLIPFIIYASLKVGSYFVHGNAPLFFDRSLTFSDVRQNITQYLLGSFILATGLSVAFGLTGYFLLSIFSTKK